MVTYPSSVAFWPEQGSLNIRDVADQRLADIPIGFMEGCGERNWSFVLQVIQDCVVEQGQLRYAATGAVVDLQEDSVSSGRYTFSRSDEPALPCSYRKGPQGSRKFRPLMPEGTDSSVSNSSRSSPGQNRFGIALIARDFECIVTNAPYQDCIGCHIVPFSRPDIYESVLGYEETYLYHVWMGMLLESSLHRAYDRGDWALFPRSEDYVVHYFDHSIRDRRNLHGKVIPFTAFRGRPDQRPHPKLLRWHYQQCVQMHFRGFSAGLSPDDALASSL